MKSTRKIMMIGSSQDDQNVQINKYRVKNNTSRFILKIMRILFKIKSLD